jgi:hypothetical protein
MDFANELGTPTVSTLLAIAVALLQGACTAGASPSVWSDHTTGTPAANLPWQDVASDSTGARLVAITGVSWLGPSGDIWTSIDTGVTWTNRTKGTRAARQAWASVASDSTGTRLVAVTGPEGSASGGDVWTTSDGGATWTKQTTLSGMADTPNVASDSTGTHLAVADWDIWTSSDSGATWSDRTRGTAAAGQSWADLASDATGGHLIAASRGGDLWTSSDHGATWIDSSKGTASFGWVAVASDSTGTNLVAACQVSVSADGKLISGDIWTSTDSGATWTNRTAGTAASGHLWTSLVSDASGAHLVAATAHESPSEIWTSADSGATWTNATAGTPASGQEWIGLASDATGSHVVAASSDPPGAGLCCMGDIWTN